MNPPALDIAHLSKSYGPLAVLGDISLRVAAGETFSLVGMNGAGKTTLIKCLLDFCDVDGGDIRILGVPHRQTAARKPLAYLPESFLPPHYLTGREFVQYMQSLRELPYDEDATHAMFAALDLASEALDRPARAYSKGMTQKLGLAACLLSDAQIFILDEPMSGLDPKARALVKRQFAALKAAGKTLFFNSHLLADVDELCDRMAILHGGGLRFVGTPSECRAAHHADTLENAYLICIGA